MVESGEMSENGVQMLGEGVGMVNGVHVKLHELVHNS